MGQNGETTAFPHNPPEPFEKWKPIAAKRHIKQQIKPELESFCSKWRGYISSSSPRAQSQAASCADVNIGQPTIFSPIM
jgi:hypothetical protein